MGAVEYVSNRMLLDICDTPMRINSQLEPIYEDFCRSFRRYNNDRHFRHTATVGLPSQKETEDELLADIFELYSGILRGANDHHSISTIRCLFTVSLYMMGIYRNDIELCKLIPSYFYLISYRLRGWSHFEN